MEGIAATWADMAWVGEPASSMFSHAHLVVYEKYGGAGFHISLRSVAYQNDTQDTEITAFDLSAPGAMYPAIDFAGRPDERCGPALGYDLGAPMILTYNVNGEVFALTLCLVYRSDVNEFQFESLGVMQVGVGSHTAVTMSPTNNAVFVV